MQLDSFDSYPHILKFSTLNYSSIAFSFDGLQLAIGNEDGQIILWDVYERKNLSQFQGYEEKVSYLKFLQNSKFLISAGIDKTNQFEDTLIKFWNVEYPFDNLVPKHIIKFFHEYKTICFNQFNTRMLIKNSENLLQQWNCEYWNQKENFYYHNQIIDKIYNQFFMSYNYIIFKNAQKKENNWNIMDIKTSKKQQIQLNQIDILSTFSNKEQEIFILTESTAESSNKQVQLVRIVESDDYWIQKECFNYFKNTLRILFSPQMKYLLYESLDHLTIFDYEEYKSLKVQSLNEFQQIIGQTYTLRDITNDFSEAIITSGCNLYLVDNKKKKINFHYTDKVQFINCKFSKDSDQKYLAALDKDQYEILIFDRQKEYQKQELFQQEQIINYEFSQKNPNIIYVFTSGRNFGFWNLEDQNQLFQIEHYFLTFNFNYKSRVFSNDLQYMALSAEDKNIYIKNLNDKTIFDLNNEYEVESMAFSQNQQFLATGYHGFIIIIPLNDIENKLYLCLGHNEKIQNIVFYQNDNYIFFSQDSILSQLKFDGGKNLQLVGIFMINHSINNFIYNQHLNKVCVFNNLEASILDIVDNVKMDIDFDRKEDEFTKNQQICSFSSNGQIFAHLNPKLVLINIEQNLQKSIELTEGSNLTFQQIANQEQLVVASSQSLTFFTVTKDLDIFKVNKVEFQSEIISFSLNQNLILSSLKNKEIIIHQIKDLNQDFKLIDIYQNFEFGLVSKNQNIYAMIKSISKNNHFNILLFNPQELPLNTQRYESLLCFTYSLNGQYVIIISSENIKIYKSDNFQIVMGEIKFEILGQIAVVSQNCQYIAVKNDEGVEIYQIIDEIQIIKKQEKFGKAEIIALSPKGDLLLTYKQFEKNNYLTIWSVKFGEKIAETEQFGKACKILEFCVDGQQFAAGLEDGTVQIYQIKEDREDSQESDAQKNHFKYHIDFFKSIPTQHILHAFRCKLSKQSKINSSKISIKEIFLLKGAIEQNLQEIGSLHN